MYQTSGFVNEELLTQVGVYFIPYQSRMVFRVCINLFVLLFFGFICVLKLLPAALMLIIALFFYRARQKARISCKEATLRKLKELSGGARIHYSSRFGKEEILAENYTSKSRDSIPYRDIVEFVQRPDIYLLVSRNGELVFVFRSQLENEVEFVKFLLSKPAKLLAWDKMRIRMLAGLTSRKK